MTQKERSRLIKKCDVAFSKKVRLRDMYCLRCGRQDTIQCAHVIPRQHLATRWDTDNAISLCYKDHIFWAHKYPHEFVEWFDERWPGRYEKLRQKANVMTRVDLEAVYEALKT